LVSAPQSLVRSSVCGAEGESVPKISFLSSVGRSSYVAGRNRSGRRPKWHLALGRGRMIEQLTGLEGVVEFALPGGAPLGLAGRKRRVWGGEPATVEIVAPDRFSACLLLEMVDPRFSFELVGTGTSWVIRLQPSDGSAWEQELLLLVQRWLEACPLPCATIVCGDRRYVFRSALTRTEVGSGFGRPQGLVPTRAVRGSKSKSLPPDRAAGAASRRPGFRQTQMALVTKP